MEQTIRRLFAAMLVLMIVMQVEVLAEYDSRLLERISEDVPYSDSIAALIEKPAADFSCDDFSITIDEYIYDGCNLYLLYTVASERDDPILFASDYPHFAGVNEWVDGEYSIAAGFGSVLCLNDQHGKSRELMATLYLDPAESDLAKNLAFTGWFFEPLTEIELNEAGYSLNIYKNGDADTLPATIECAGIARQVAQVDVSLPVKAEKRDVRHANVPMRTDFDIYSVTVTKFIITPLSTKIEFCIDAQTAQGLQPATKHRSYAVRDIDGNEVLDMDWYSEELEDESATPYVQYIGNGYGQSTIPNRIQLVPLSIEALNSILDQNPDVSWADAEKRASMWEEAVWIDIEP